MTLTDPSGLPTLSVVANEDGEYTAVFSCAHGITEAPTPTLNPHDANRAIKPRRTCNCEAERFEYYWPTHEARVAALDDIGPYFGLQSLSALMADTFRPTECGCDALPGVAWQSGMIGPITAHAPDCVAQLPQSVRLRWLDKEAKE